MDIVVQPLPSEDVPAESMAPRSEQNDLHLLIARQFDIDTPTQEEEGKLKEIWDHAHSLSATGDLQDVLWQAINLRRSLGAPKLGEAPIDRVYRWAKLKRQESEVANELRNI